MSEYARRVDGNHSIIRDAVRAAGYCWIDLFRVGHGIPDALVVSKSRLVALFEIKMPGEKLTAQEQLFFDSYPGYIYIVTSPEDALDRLAWLDAAEVKLPIRSIE